MSTLTRSTDDTTLIATSVSGTSSVTPHRRARASVLASVSMLVGLPGVLAVGTGVLAVPGAALGLLAALIGLGAVRATRQTHIAGRGNAIVGLLLGLAALAAGTLAAVGVMPGIDGETNQVTRVANWLESHLPGWVTPES